MVQEDKRGFPGSVGLSRSDMRVALRDTSVRTYCEPGVFVGVHPAKSDNAIGFRRLVSSRNQFVVLQQSITWKYIEIYRSRSQIWSIHGPFCLDLEIRVIWAYGNLCVTVVEGERGDWADVSLLDVQEAF
jgi:hypothetical protein